LKRSETVSLLAIVLLAVVLLIGIPEGWWSLTAILSYVPYFIIAGILGMFAWGFRDRIQEGLKPPQPERESQGATLAYETYRKEFLKAIRSTPRPQIDFGVTATLQNRATFTVDDFTRVVIEHKRVILRGQAGGGKSVFLAKLSESMANGAIIPLFLDLKRWNKDYSEAMNAIQKDDLGTFEKRLDLLLRVSVAELSLGFHKKLPSDLARVVLVDGLNEVYGEEAIRQILGVVDEYVRQYGPNACALVADREVPRAFLGTRWITARIDLLDSNEVQRHIDTKFGVGTYSHLPKADRDLLRTPYFLDSALLNKSPRLGSRAASIERFFINQLGIRGADLDTLGKLAFEIYRDYQSPSFEAEKLKSQVTDEIWRKLSGALKEPIEGFTQFDHQLKHDYLVSRHLAKDEKLWEPRSFDAATFESNSYDSLLMVSEQLTDETSGDRFLKQVYDWNWSVTVACLANAGLTNQRHHSRELETAILYLIAEKKFDPVHRTADRAGTQLKNEFPSNSVAGKLRNIESLNDVYAIDELVSDKAWFLRWKKLFMRNESPPLDETEIAQIIDSDSVIGWTAANVIKRFQLTETGLRQLRAYYRAIYPDPDPSKALVRWRIVHALGAFDDPENVRVLFEALDQDSYMWVNYGAVRSLVEIAAKTLKETLRTEIIGQLAGRIKSMRAKVLEEMGQTMFYRNPPKTWLSLCGRLLESVRDAQTRDADEERWTKTVEDFSEFCRKYGL
jgi:hypothetical protein